MLFDLIDIELLANIAETKSFTQGALLSHMCLSAASKRIKHVEERLGTKVFYRDAEGVALTLAGKTLYDGGRRVLHQMDHLRDDLKECTKGAKGRIRVSAPTTVSTEYLPAVFCRYLANHPDVSIDLRVRLSREVVREVAEELSEIGIVARKVRTDGLEVLPYRHERWVLITSPEHPLAARKTIRFEETLDFEYIVLPENSTTQVLLAEAVGATDRVLKVRVQAANFAVVTRMVEANLGIGIMSESIARQSVKHSRIKVVTLSDDWAKFVMQICVKDRKALPGYARDLLNLLMAEGNEPASEPSEAMHRNGLRHEQFSYPPAVSSR